MSFPIEAEIDVCDSWERHKVSGMPDFLIIRVRTPDGQHLNLITPDNPVRTAREDRFGRHHPNETKWSVELQNDCTTEPHSVEKTVEKHAQRLERTRASAAV